MSEDTSVYVGMMQPSAVNPLEVREADPMTEQLSKLVETMLMAVRDDSFPLMEIKFLDGTPDEERFLALARMSKARFWHKHCVARLPDFRLGWEPVAQTPMPHHEKVRPASMMLTGRWTNTEGTTPTHCVYPKGMQAHLLASAIELHLEHCAQVF